MGFYFFRLRKLFSFQYLNICAKILYAVVTPVRAATTQARALTSQVLFFITPVHAATTPVCTAMTKASAATSQRFFLHLKHVLLSLT